jgi:hypothetical protein
MIYNRKRCCDERAADGVSLEMTSIDGHRDGQIWRELRDGVCPQQQQKKKLANNDDGLQKCNKVGPNS